MTKQKSLFLFIGLLSLTACSRDQAPNKNAHLSGENSSITTPNNTAENTGNATLTIDLVRANRADGVANSVARLYRSGDRYHKQVIALATTDSKGVVSFNKIPYGSYDVSFSKAGSAGSEVRGIRLSKDQQVARVKVAQFDARDPHANPSVPQLVIQTPSKTDENGKPTSWNTLKAGSVFKDKIQVRTHTAHNNGRRFIMRYVMFSVVSFDKNGQMQEWREGLDVFDSGKINPGARGNQYSKAVELSGHGLSGDVYLHVSAMDFNDNRSAYLVPIRLENTKTFGKVTAPTGVKAVSYTLQKQIGYILSTNNQKLSAQDLSTQAAPKDSNLWVNVYWDAPKDLDNVSNFEILRSEKEQGPYIKVASAPTKNCRAICQARDYTATLEEKKTYYYKVAAVGENVAPSNAVATYTLGRFVPELVGPSAEQNNVDLTPIYHFKTNVAQTGANGAQFYLRLEDLFTNAARVSFPGLDFKTIAGKTTISGVKTKKDRVYFEKGSDKNVVLYDKASDNIYVPHLLGYPAKLQTNHRYSWLIHAAYAYRLADINKPASKDNPVVAYSVFSDPDRRSNPLVPDGVHQSRVDIHHFITKP